RTYTPDELAILVNYKQELAEFAASQPIDAPERNGSAPTETGPETAPDAGPDSDPETDGGQPEPEPDTEPAAAPDNIDPTEPTPDVPLKTPGATFDPSVFPEDGVALPRYYSTVLAQHALRYPAPYTDPDTGEVRELSSHWIDFDSQSVYDGEYETVAFIGAIVEFIAGAMLILGVFVRIAGVGVIGVMLTAMWLTEIGPAMQNGTALLGFLPPYDPLATEEWVRALWQFAMLCGGLSIFFSGSGTFALSRIFGNPYRLDLDGRSSAKASDDDE
ncbi:MAG: DoxX family membrane protein, partial [Planctomycetota bacterium]